MINAFTPRLLACGLVVAAASVAAPAHADSGFFIGGSAGGATLEAEFDPTSLPGLPSSFDEDDTAWKLFAGYKLDLPLITLGVEGGYVNFGQPDLLVAGSGGPIGIEVETTGLNVWGTAGVELGPLDLYGKLGMISWDIEAGIDGFGSVEDDGTDPAYGVGLSFGLGSLELRGEYEIYDFDDADYEMLSVGIAFRF